MKLKYFFFAILLIVAITFVVDTIRISGYLANVKGGILLVHPQSFSAIIRSGYWS